MTRSTLHWFLPTTGDSRTDLSHGNAVGRAPASDDGRGPAAPADLDYLGQIARSAEQLGFEAALTPTSRAGARTPGCSPRR